MFVFQRGRKNDLQNIISHARACHFLAPAIPQRSVQGLCVWVCWQLISEFLLNLIQTSESEFPSNHLSFLFCLSTGMSLALPSSLPGLVPSWTSLGVPCSLRPAPEASLHPSTPSLDHPAAPRSTCKTRPLNHMPEGNTLSPQRLCFFSWGPWVTTFKCTISSQLLFVQSAC